MTVSGHEIIEVCQACYSEKGFGVRLKKTDDGLLECPVDNGHRYRVVDGFLERV
ncbi:MAG: hypothetical protein NTY90_01805 [Candidatus Micrarchaeota archaeon]|nr:hypothetical protein [Candidatus Micrarchaeota archaeon]